VIVAGITAVVLISRAATPNFTVTSPAGFTHPGIMVNQAQLDFVKSKIAAGQEPYLTEYNRARSSRFASTSYVARPVATIDCTANSAGCTAETEDAQAAYIQALLWYYSGQRVYAQNAIKIMNAWSATMRSSNGNQSHLNHAWAAGAFPRAAEIMRYTFTPATGEVAFNVSAFSTMLKNVMLPRIQPGTAQANNSNGNWELSFTEGVMNIGVFTDDRAVFNQGVSMWRARVPAYIYLTSDGARPIAPPGGVYNDPAKLRCFWLAASTITSSCSVPPNFAYANGQSQETCRDVSHTTMGFEAMIQAAETARLQGVDLYGEQRTRITTGFEFHARWTTASLNNQAPPASVCSGAVLPLGGNAYTYGWEVAYNHYTKRLGQAMPYTQSMVSRVRPTSSGLHMNWQSLTHAETGNAVVPSTPTPPPPTPTPTKTPTPTPPPTPTPTPPPTPTPTKTPTPTPTSGPVDSESPKTPTGFVVTLLTDQQVALKWNASSDNVAVNGYRVYRGSTKLVDQTTLAYVAQGLSPSTGYTFGVEAYDGAGNVSGRATLSATTQAPPSSGPVTAPGGGNPIVITPPGTTTPVAIPATAQPVVGGNIAIKTPDAVKTIVKVDGMTVYADGTLDTTYLKNGQHTVTVESTDANGNTQVASRVLQVENDLTPWQYVRNQLFAPFKGNKLAVNSILVAIGLLLLSGAGYLIYRRIMAIHPWRVF
jgi:cell division septation protein DedD